MFKIFKRLTTKELIMIVLVVIFVCLNVYLNLKIPDYMSDITTLLSTKGTKASDIFAWNTDAPGMRMLLMSFAGFMLEQRQVLPPVFVMISSIRF